MLLIGLQQVFLLLVGALVFLLEVGQGTGVEHCGQLLAVKVQPVKVSIFIEDFFGIASAIVDISAAGIREDGVGKCDLLEFLVGFFAEVFADLVYTPVVSWI
jgi:hypothetical protein